MIDALTSGCSLHTLLPQGPFCQHGSESLIHPFNGERRFGPQCVGPLLHLLCFRALRPIGSKGQAENEASRSNFLGDGEELLEVSCASRPRNKRVGLGSDTEGVAGRNANASLPYIEADPNFALHIHTPADRRAVCVNSFSLE